jgi:predicted DNA-binding transcriptional regulator AlpA
MEKPKGFSMPTPDLPATLQSMIEAAVAHAVRGHFVVVDDDRLRLIADHIVVREPERRLVTGCSRSEWGRLQRQGRAPPPIVIGRRCCWRLVDLVRWVEAQAAVPDSDERREGRCGAHASRRRRLRAAAGKEATPAAAS